MTNIVSTNLEGIHDLQSALRSSLQIGLATNGCTRERSQQLLGTRHVSVNGGEDVVERILRLVESNRDIFSDSSPDILQPLQRDSSAVCLRQSLARRLIVCNGRVDHTVEEH